MQPGEGSAAVRRHSAGGRRNEQQLHCQDVDGRASKGLMHQGMRPFDVLMVTLMVTLMGMLMVMVMFVLA